MGSATVNDGGLLVKHNGQNSTSVYILGEELYSQGRQIIGFKIEQSQTPYNIFFACVSSQIYFNQMHYKPSSVAGWFGSNQVYQRGTCKMNVKMHGYDSNKTETYDISPLTCDCDQRQIEF